MKRDMKRIDIDGSKAGSLTQMTRAITELRSGEATVLKLHSLGRQPAPALTSLVSEIAQQTGSKLVEHAADDDSLTLTIISGADAPLPEDTEPPTPQDADVVTPSSSGAQPLTMVAAASLSKPRRLPWD